MASWIKRTVRGVVQKVKKQPTVTQIDLPAKKQEAKRIVDVTSTPPGQPGPAITGGITVTGGTGYRGGGGTITKIDDPSGTLSGFSPQQIENLAGAKLPVTSTGVSAQQQRIKQEFRGQELTGEAQPIATTTTIPGGIGTREEQVFQVRGEQVGRTFTDPRTGQQFAQVQQPSTLRFPQPSRGSVQDIILGDEGIDILERAEPSFPTLFPSKAELIVSQRDDPGILMTRTELKERGISDVIPMEGEGPPTVRERRTMAVEKWLDRPSGDVLFIPGTAKAAMIPPLEKAKEGYQTFSNVITQIDTLGGISLSAQAQSQGSRLIATPIIITPSPAALASIAKTTKVAFTGVTQQVSSRKVITDAAFQIKYPTLFAKTEKGVITTTTLIGKSGTGVKQVISAAVGRTGFTKLVFPTGKITIGAGKQFTGVSKGVAVMGKTTTLTTSFGKILQGTRISRARPFFDIGIIKKGESVIGVIGKTFVGGRKATAISTSPTTGIETVGLLKQATTTSPLILDVRGTMSLGAIPRTISPTISSLQGVGFLQTQSFVRGLAATITPRATGIPMVSALSLSATEFTRTIPTTRETTQTFTRAYTGVVPKTSQFFIPIQKQPTISSTMFATSSTSLTKQKQIFQQVSVQRPLQVQIPKQAQKISQRFLFVRPPITITPTILASRIRGFAKPKPFFPPFKFSTAKPTKQEKELFPVLVRRRGKFKIAGFGRTPMEAIGIGKEIVSTTLARTFKVPSATIKDIPGFKTKITKKGIKFIEPSKRALGTSSELKEIQSFQKRAMKGGRKKRK